jgi:Tfp pilus assembly protein PilV
VITGISSLPAKKSRGFSYIELLISLLILSSGLWCFTELTLRTQLAQIKSNKQFKGVLMMDYLATQLAIGNRGCVKANHGSKISSTCGLASLLPSYQLTGAIDKNSRLFKGYALTDSDPIGCISHISVAKSYLVGLDYSNAGVVTPASGLCKDQSINLPLETPVTLL